MTTTRHAPSTLTDLLFDKSDAGLCLVAPDGTVVRVNAEWLRSTGFAEGQVIGERILDLFPETRDVALAMHARAQAGHRVEVPRHAQLVNGRERWWDGSIEPVAMEGGTGVLITAREVRRQSEERLRAALERLRVHVESTPLALVEWDSEFRVVGYSGRAREVLGWSADDVLGKRIDEIPWVPAEDWPSVRAVMHDMTTGARPTNVNANRNVREDGTVIACEWYNSTLRDEHGRLVSVLSLVLDVTERERALEALRASEEKFRSVFEQAAVGIGRVRFTDARWIDVNDAFCRMLGRSREEMLATPWPDITHPDDVDLDLVPFGRMSAGALDSYTVEKRFFHADGHEVWARLTLSLVRDASGRPEYEIAIIEDIGDRKRAQESLREADRRKDEFLAMLSHELRNPLAPIRNSTFVLRHAQPGSEQARRAQAIIERQAEHLTRLVDDLLDVTRIARGKVELRLARVDLVEVVRRAAEDHRALLTGGGARLVVDVPAEPAWADADATRLTQAIGNLLHNAGKFTPPGGEIRVDLRVSGSTAEVRVRDTGAGIEAELLSRIFEPFVQSDRTLARTQGGLGLGLALVKGFVELHGGTVRASSGGAGRGTEFVLTLPLVATVPDAAASGAVPGTTADGRRVLIVDDNRDAAESLGQIVELLGSRAEVVFDGPSALRAVRAREPAIVLCDIGLPGMSGYDVARAIRAVHPRVQLFALSGYAQPDDVRRAIEAGFDGHLAKPLRIEDLERLLA